MPRKDCGRPSAKAQVLLDKTKAQLATAKTSLMQLPNSDELINKTKDLNKLIYQLYHLNPQATISTESQSLITTYLDNAEVEKIATHNNRVALMITKKDKSYQGKRNNENKKDLIAAATKVVARHITVVNNRIANESGPTEKVNTIKGDDLAALSNSRTRKVVRKKKKDKKDEEAAAAKKKAVKFTSTLSSADLHNPKKLAEKRKLEGAAKELASKTDKGSQRKRNKIEGIPVEDWIEKGVENLKGCYYPMDNVELDPKEEKKWDDEWDTIEPSKEAKDILAEYLNRRG